jgi:hypothetical protein
MLTLIALLVETRRVLVARIFPRPAPVLYWKRLTGRDARGRFVSKSWTQAARSYSEADLAWFASRPQF